MDIRLLLVCPDQDAAALLRNVLSEMGIEAEHTPSLAHGLVRLEEDKFDAVVFDYRGDAASEEFLARLRHSAKNQKTMLIAVVEEECNARPLFGLGANFVLYRPSVAGAYASELERGAEPDAAGTAASAAGAGAFAGQYFLSGGSRSGRDDDQYQRHGNDDHDAQA